MAASKQLKRVLIMLLGGALVLVGVVLLVLPGPGLLLVLAGLVTLAAEFPSLEKYVDPVRDRAMKGMEAAVSSPLNVAGSVLAGLGLIGLGVVWGLRLFPWLPLPGWATGSSLIISGVILFGLLGYSYHRVSQRRRSAAGQEP
ncbi:PGPGW domain-containing protein [Allokutzneria multivorans]|uniref:PGPGW domain-containing protein n=1 Tax=Allokutzneria multivorans TaxID=1142134 RepID=A0ABP7QV66_9PSEU